MVTLFDAMSFEWDSFEWNSYQYDVELACLMTGGEG